MRSLLVALIVTMGCGFASAETLSDADREALLERLDSLKAAAVERTDARFRAAVAAYTAAMASDDAALDLYLKCVEKVDFEDQKRKQGDFREWKRKKDEELSKPGFKVALRHQLKWLVLTLQAASEKADRAKLAPVAQQLMDGVFRDGDALKDQQTVLKQAVTGTVFAKAYEIAGLKLEKWPTSPIEVAGIYEQVIFPPLRNAEGLSHLREAWQRRIQQEGMMIEYWAPVPKDGAGKERIGMADVRSPELEKFISETVPTLQWQMEMDLFKNGDQVGAAQRMLAHIEKNVAHTNAKDWSEQFRTLLAPPAPKPTAGGKGL